jgi:hypothetical protein
VNEYEAQLKVAGLVRDVLVSLSETDLSPDEVETMGDVADMIIEALDLKVTGIEGTLATCTLDLSDPE